MAGVTFDLRLKDLMSGPLGNVQSKANAAFGSIGRSIGRAQTGMDTMVRSAGNLGGSFSNGGRAAVNSLDGIGAAARKAERDVANLNRSAKGVMIGGNGSGGGKSGGGFLGTAAAMGLGGMAAGAVTAAARFAMEQGKSVLDAGMQGSQVKAQFEAMNGVTAGGKLYGDVTKYVQDSIFGNELYKMAGLLNSFGVGIKDILPDLKMLGDISGGDKERMQGLSLAFSQVTAAGKMQGQDKMQFVNAGFNPIAEYAAHTGKSQSYYNDLMSDGKFTDKMMKQSILWATGAGGKFNGMLDNISRTPAGKLAAMGGNIDNAKLQMGTALLPAMSRLMDSMRPMIDGLPAMLDKLVPYGEKMAKNFSDSLPYIQKMGGAIGGALRPVIDLMTSRPVQDLGNNILALSTTIVNGLTPAIKLMASAAATVASGANAIAALIPGHKSSTAGLPSWGGELRGSRQINHMFQPSERERLRDYIGNRYGGKIEDWMNNPKEKDFFRKNNKFIEDMGGINPMAMMGISPMGIGFGVNDKMGISKLKGGLKDPEMYASDKRDPVFSEKAQAVSDSIAGGGKRQIIFNIKNVVGSITNNPASSGEAVQVTEDNIIGAMARLAAMSAEIQ